MVVSVLLVLTENFDDMMFLASQVILEEHGFDTLICSIENGTAKGQDSSVMTIALDEVISQKVDYGGIILIHGSNFENWPLLNEVLDDLNFKNKLIGFSSSSLKLISKYGYVMKDSNERIVIHNNFIHLTDLDSSENFAEKFVKILSN